MMLQLIFLLTSIMCLASLGDTKIPSSVLYDMKEIKTLPDLMRALPISASNHLHPSRDKRPSSHQNQPPKVSDSAIHVFARNQINSIHPFQVNVPDLPACEPRPTFVNTESLLEVNEDTIFWPHCLSVNKCSGCCDNDLFECVAMETRARTAQLIRMVYDPLDMRLKFDGVTAIDIPDETECACRCKVRRSHCRLDREEFSNCQCQCMVELMCPPNFRWDPVSCDCVCGIPQSERFCRNKREIFNSTVCGCSCDPEVMHKCRAKGLGFNSDKCKCVNKSRYGLFDSS